MVFKNRRGGTKSRTRKVGRWESKGRKASIKKVSNRKRWRTQLEGRGK